MVDPANALRRAGPSIVMTVMASECLSTTTRVVSMRRSFLSGEAG
jgi:hypothetical protein